MRKRKAARRRKTRACGGSVTSQVGGSRSTWPGVGPPADSHAPVGTVTLAATVIILYFKEKTKLENIRRTVSVI